MNQSSTGPVFLVGVWRSGTSLLHALLNQHPRIGLMYEAELPLLQALFSRSGANRDWLNRWDFWNGALTRHGLAPEEFPSRPGSFRGAVETVYGRYSSRTGATVWGEKSPNYWDRMDRIHDWFPDARFIVVFRDPQAVCRSVIEAGQDGGYFAKRGMPLRALLACEMLKSQSDELRKRGAPLHVLEYEDLVRNPAATLGGICDFLGLPFEPKMASLGDADRQGFYDGSHHALAKGDRIVASRERKDLVPPDFSRKIDGYIAYWHGKYSGKWPAHPAPGMRSAPAPGRFERMADQALFRLLRKFDAAVAAVYCRAPLSLLNRYRKSKGIRRPPGQEQDAGTGEDVPISRGA